MAVDTKVMPVQLPLGIMSNNLSLKNDLLETVAASGFNSLLDPPKVTGGWSTVAIYYFVLYIPSDNVPLSHV